MIFRCFMNKKLLFHDTEIGTRWAAMCCVIKFKITITGKKWYLNNGDYEDDLRSASPRITVLKLC